MMRATTLFNQIHVAVLGLTLFCDSFKEINSLEIDMVFELWYPSRYLPQKLIHTLGNINSRKLCVSSLSFNRVLSMLQSSQESGTIAGLCSLSNQCMASNPDRVFYELTNESKPGGVVAGKNLCCCKSIRVPLRSRIFQRISTWSIWFDNIVSSPMNSTEAMRHPCPVNAIPRSSSTQDRGR